MIPSKVDTSTPQAERRASEILERIADPVVSYDRQFRYTYVSRRTAERLGKTPEQMIGKVIWDVFPQIAGTGLEEASERAWAEGKPVVIERFSPLAGGWLETYIYPFEGGAVAQWHPVTERKAAEAALRETEAQLARTQEFSLVMPVQMGVDGRFLKAPPTFVRFLGYDNESELLGRCFKDVTHPDEFQPEWNQVQQLLRGEIKSFEMEKQFIRKDGSVTWAYMNCSIVTDSEGKPVYLLKYVRDINKWKRAEAALRASESNARSRLAEIEAIYESSPVGLALLGADLRFVRVNRRFAQMNGYAAEAHAGKTPGELNPDLGDIAEEAFRRVMESGEPVLNLEVRGTTASRPGVQRVWNEHLVPVLDEHGKIAGISVAAEEITDRKRAEQDLQQQKQQYETLAENAPEIITRFDSEFRHIYVNNYGAAVYGIPKSEILGRTSADLGFADDTVALWNRAFEQVFATGRQQTLDFEFDTPNFGHQYFSSLLVPETGGGGRVTSILSITRDVTGLKRAEREARESRDLLALALEGARAGTFDLDLKTNEVEWSKELRQVHGIGPEDPVSLEAWVEGTLPEDRERALGATAAVCEEGEGILQFRIRRRDTGEIRWLEGRSRAIRDKSGAPVRVLGVGIDITEQKRAEEALRDSERQFREIAESLPQIVWVTDASGAVTYTNRRWSEQFGIDGANWAEPLHPEDRGRALDHWRHCVETGERYQIEFRIRPVDGEYRWFLSRAVPLRDEDGRITRWFGTSTDIDDSKRAEERLRETQKLESVGLLAGGIAHDFNNLLTGILGNASLVLEEVGPGPAERIKECISSAERAAELTRQLLAYAGRGQFIQRDLDVSEMVHDIGGLVEFSIPKSIQLTVNVQRRLPLVRMDPSQLQQVLMNLVINAGEAIGEGNPGRITVATSAVEIERPFVDGIGQEIPPGRYVSIEVSDTGPGIADEVKSRIFDPFVTTRFPGRGLGLAAVAGIIRAQKGAITVESALGRGSTFRVLLPAAERGVDRRSKQPEAGGRGAILVADDEPSVRNLMTAVLKRHGFSVLPASDGKEALAILDREKGKVDAVILDVVMPVMGAKDLLPLMKALYPDVGILLTSGYSESEARRLCAAYPGADFIEKPYTARQLLKAVVKTLEKRGPRDGTAAA